ncbi:uncharacterized protein CIMG_05749 [Coccidioides immitis RS]|uniref:Uncharacterized protein n=4 Tax=Coccidioides immitis TaxID=5501 RepID=J3K6P5_COCIM|nr:uncharacterized protein CIMG_05749 [Coccidioides immitis RS]EAS30270.3 hypothetical protein CIMG_05749 [Coccidioides immitis RS]KMP02824.1 hypothetical protein CIRG_02516 [Coccidioides immitis RMSCC 2394]KMU77212.1 hypothetical protein CISG_06056 [Coccidioides immitis RMSCC 3703]KMU91545.1 hypothetical protein CIHG_09355 [Coccidioides immitis H538.4]
MIGTGPVRHIIASRQPRLHFPPSHSLRTLLALFSRRIAGEIAKRFCKEPWLRDRSDNGDDFRDKSDPSRENHDSRFREGTDCYNGEFTGELCVSFGCKGGDRFDSRCVGPGCPILLAQGTTPRVNAVLAENIAKVPDAAGKAAGSRANA